MACAECDSSLPFSGASSIPLCYIPFPSTLFQLVFHPPSLHLATDFMVYLSALFLPNSYIILFWEFYFLPFSVHAQTNVIYLTLLLYTLSFHPSPPTILPSSLTSSCHLFLGLPLSPVVPKFIYNTLLGILFPSILCTCPNQRNLFNLIVSVIVGFLHFYKFLYRLLSSSFCFLPFRILPFMECSLVVLL